MVLLVANSRDFATDYVVAELLRRGQKYERLDLDLASEDRVSLDPIRRQLRVDGKDHSFTVSESDLQSVLFRAPTHLRESSAGRYEPDKLLARHQWAAFARSLMVFDHARWMNHPKSTYAAENKPFQLSIASKLGFEAPETIIANCNQDRNSMGENRVAVKALDTFLLRVEDGDAFFYTQLLGVGELESSSLQQMPFIQQNAIEPKVDLRVTVVGNRFFPASVTREGRGIEGDWRLAKDAAEFMPYDLPASVGQRCVDLVSELGLAFGAIDLALCRDKFYFLEVNPTGEWAWLLETTGGRIDRAIADWLLSG